MQGPLHWRGIYDDQEIDGRHQLKHRYGRDAWEHADDPYDPIPRTGLVCQLGVDNAMYAITR